MQLSSLAQIGESHGFRKIHRERNPGQSEAVVIVNGGKDGYVGRDGQAVGGGAHTRPPGAPAAAGEG